MSAPQTTTTASKADLMAASKGAACIDADGSVWTKTSDTQTSSSRWTNEAGYWCTSNQLAAQAAGSLVVVAEATSSPVSLCAFPECIHHLAGAL